MDGRAQRESGVHEGLARFPRSIHCDRAAVGAADADHAAQLAKFTLSERVPFLVTGASGSLGRATVNRLLADGHRVRVYPLSEHPLKSGMLGRIFRCSTVMVNVLAEDDQPRDPTQLSPHHHDDFEQVSLQVHGDYVHHMRVPWTPDSSTWRDDEHQRCAAPAVVVIPPPLVHTSQSVEAMHHWLIDVFAPPRPDLAEEG